MYSSIERYEEEEIYISHFQSSFHQLTDSGLLADEVFFLILYYHSNTLNQQYKSFSLTLLSLSNRPYKYI